MNLCRLTCECIKNAAVIILKHCSCRLKMCYVCSFRECSAVSSGRGHGQIDTDCNIPRQWGALHKYRHGMDIEDVYVILKLLSLLNLNSTTTRRTSRHRRTVRTTLLDIKVEGLLNEVTAGFKSRNWRSKSNHVAGSSTDGRFDSCFSFSLAKGSVDSRKRLRNLYSDTIDVIFVHILHVYYITSIKNVFKRK